MIFFMYVNKAWIVLACGDWICGSWDRIPLGCSWEVKMTGYIYVCILSCSTSPKTTLTGQKFCPLWRSLVRVSAAPKLKEAWNCQAVGLRCPPMSLKSILAGHRSLPREPFHPSALRTALTRPLGTGNETGYSSDAPSIHARYRKQGCQMVCFQTKNPNLGKFWRVL
jgi:hypothetical protein